MSRPTQEQVEDGLCTWQRAVYELHREIDKLDQEKEQLIRWHDEVVGLNTELEIRGGELERLLRIAQSNALDAWPWHANLHAQVDRALGRPTDLENAMLDIGSTG